jgi:hypothetical protein
LVKSLAVDLDIADPRYYLTRGRRLNSLNLPLRLCTFAFISPKQPEERETQRRRGHREEKHKEERREKKRFGG